MKPLIPIRPAGNFSMKSEEMDCLTWYVLSGCSRQEAFARFLRPELAVSKVTLEKASQQFFASKNAISYLEAYRNEISALAEAKANAAKPKYSAEERKSKKEEAIQKLTDFVITSSLNIEYEDDKESILKFADKLGLLESEEEVVEVPRRYLPESCSECRYKKFIEENCEETSD